MGFYRRYDPDIIVIMPGPLYVAEAWDMDIRSSGNDSIAHYAVSPAIARATEWRQLSAVDVSTSSLQREIEAVRLVKAQLDQDDAPLIFPLFSPLTTADILCQGRVIEDMRSFSNDLRSGLEIIASVTIDLANACLEAGIDGFMLINRLASRDQLRSREYRTFGREYDLQVLEPLARRAEISILNLVGRNLLFDQVGYYPVQAVSWETWHADPSIANASRQIRCGLMGGLNPATFANGSVRDVQDQISSAIEQSGGWHFVVAPSAPLPPDSKDTLLASIGPTIRSL
jgi:uroporphyrinogen decarboxylase